MKKKIGLFILTLLVVGFGCWEQAQAASTKTIKQTINQLVKQKGFSGTITVVKNGRVIIQTSRGYANYAKKQPNRSQNQYQIASIQKSMTAEMIAKLASQKKLTLNDKLSKYYPKIKNADQVTLRQLLNMVSGLKVSSTISLHSFKSQQAYLNYLGYHATIQTNKIGQWQYSSFNYNLLAGIVEQVSGKSYQQYFKQVIAKPLGIKNYSFVTKFSSNVAQGYYNRGLSHYQAAGKLGKTNQYMSFGAGTIAMSGQDLYKVLAAMLSGKLIGTGNAQDLYSSKYLSGTTYTAGFYHVGQQLIRNQATYHMHGRQSGVDTAVEISADGQNAVIVQSNNGTLTSGGTINHVIDLPIYKKLVGYDDN